MRIAVVGAGAIGSYLGALLARAGHEVHLIARGAHLDAVVAGNGLAVEDQDGAWTAPVRATDDPARDVGPVEAVLLVVKAHQQLAAAPLVTPLLGPDTPVVAVQNGIPWWYFHAHPDAGLRDRIIEAVDPNGALTAALDPTRAIGAVAYLGATRPAPGVVHARPEAGLRLGEPDGSDSPRLAAVSEALRSTGLDVRTSEPIRTEIWLKLLGNVTFNPVSMLTRSTLGQGVHHPGTRAVVATAMQEALDVAAALGSQPAMSIPERLKITERLGEHKTSTLQDLEAGRSVELDALTGAVCELARMTGTPAPTLEILHSLADLEAQVLGLRDGSR